MSSNTAERNPVIATQARHRGFTCGSPDGFAPHTALLAADGSASANPGRYRTGRLGVRQGVRS
jgi:hypothetical protein